MNYAKPEVNRLGDAASGIQDLTKDPNAPILETNYPSWGMYPSYTLDD